MCSPAAGPPTTSTCRSSATATPSRSSDRNPAVRGRPALHRRPPCRGRAAGWPPDRSNTRRPSRPNRPELTSELSWPTLRAHLLALAAETGEHPLLHLHTAAARRELHAAADMAGVLDWRLPDPQPLTQRRFLGFPAFRKPSMIIPFGVNTWRSGSQQSPTSPIASEIKPVRTARSVCVGVGEQPPEPRHYR